MVRKFKIVALAGALMMAASPVFAQDVLGDLTKGLGDLDPSHILSPAPAPAAAPAAKKKHHMHKKMMRKKMTSKKMVMHKKMMKK